MGENYTRAGKPRSTAASFSLPETSVIPGAAKAKPAFQEEADVALKALLP